MFIYSAVILYIFNCNIRMISLTFTWTLKTPVHIFPDRLHPNSEHPSIGYTK